jgi:hypothetical protein
MVLVKTKEPRIMTDAQVGLVIATPIIIIFAFALYRMGVLQRYSTVSAVVFSAVIAAILFTQQG